MMSKAEVLRWINAQPDGAQIWIDEGGLMIESNSGGWLEIGGDPQEGGAR